VEEEIGRGRGKGCLVILKNNNKNNVGNLTRDSADLVCFNTITLELVGAQGYATVV